MPSLQIVSKVVGKKVSQAPDLRRSAPKPKKSESDSSCTKSTPTFSHLKVGCKVKFPLSNKVANGTLRFIGPTKFSGGLWCGIELSRPDGRNNGTVKGVKYFQCKFNYGIFVHAEKVKLAEDEDIESGKGNSTSQLVRRLSSKDSSESPVNEGEKVNQVIGSDIFDGKLVECKEEKPHSATQDSSRSTHQVEACGTAEENSIDVLLNSKETENQVDDTCPLVQTLENDSNLDDKYNDMRAIIAAEVEVENSPLTIKIAKGVSDDDDDKTIEHVAKSEFEDGLLFYVTAHQTAPISQSQNDRRKSCPVINSSSSEEEIFADENKSNTWPKYSKSEFANLRDERLRDGPTKLRRRLSGIEKRIHLSHFRPPSPGSLKKSLSQSAVYPKENYVAYDESTVKKPRFLVSLKRSVSNVTEYNTRDASLREANKSHVGKRWMSGEKAAPDVFGNGSVDGSHDEEKSTELYDSRPAEPHGCEKDENEERKLESQEFEDVMLESVVDDVSNSFVVIDEIDDQDEKETAEPTNHMENEGVSLSSTSLVEEDLVIINAVTSEKDAIIDDNIYEKSVIKEPAEDIQCTDEPALKNEEKPRNIMEKSEVTRKSSQEQTGNGLLVFPKARLTKHLSYHKDQPVCKVAQRKISSPVVAGKTGTLSNFRPMSNRLSQSHIELSNKAEAPKANFDNSNGRVPKKLTKRVSDLVANFEKTKDGGVQQKGSKSSADMKVEAKEKKPPSLGKRREAASDKEVRNHSLKVTPRKTSQVNKEELAGKETLSRQYLKEDGKKRICHTHKDASTGHQAAPKSNTITTGRSGIPGYSKRNLKTPAETSKKHTVSLKSLAVKQEKSNDLAILSPVEERNVNVVEPSIEAQEEIKILKAKCLDCEKRIYDLKNGIKEKNLAMEAFIIVIKQYIKMIEEQSGKQMQLQHDNKKLVTELKCQTNLAASNVEKCRGLEKTIASLTDDYGQEINALKAKHVLETESLLDELNKEHQQEMGQANTKFDKEISRLKDYHDDKISKLQSEHEAAMKSLKDDFEQAFNSKDEEFSSAKEDITHQFKKEKEEICSEYEERLEDLKNQLESAEQQRHEFEVKSRELQFELDKDLESKIQGALAKYKDLPAELESLQAVIEMKNEDIKKSRAHNMELQKRLEDYYELEKKYVKLSQEKEAIDAALQNKVKCERQLSVEKESLQANLEKEARKVKRLSMEKEELLWKVSNASSSMSLSSPSLNIDLSATPNGFQSTPNTTRSLNRSLKTQSLYLPPLDDEDYTVL